DWPTYLACKDQVLIAPDWPKDCTLLVLIGSVLLQHSHELRSKGDCTATMLGLGLLELEPCAELIPERSADFHRSAHQVHILPAERKQLSLTHSSDKREHKERMQPLQSACRQKGARLACVEHLHLSMSHTRRFDRIGDITRYQPLLDRVY